jgi:cytoskeletal protein RodZ
MGQRESVPPLLFCEHIALPALSYKGREKQTFGNTVPVNITLLFHYTRRRLAVLCLRFSKQLSRFMMKNLTALIVASLFAGAAFAQAPVTTTTTPNGTATAPATKSDVNAAAKAEKAEIKANEKAQKAAADAAETSVKADAKAAKKEAHAQAKAEKKIVDAKKDAAKAQIDADTKVEHDHAHK